METENSSPQPDAPAHARLLVKDVPASLRFYGALGFTLTKQDDVFTCLQWAPGALVYLVKTPAHAAVPAPAPGSGVLLCFATDRLDDLTQRAAQHAFKFHGPVLQPWHTRELTLADPDGHRLVFFQRATDGTT
jgi:lactoylglutathione lyase